MRLERRYQRSSQATGVVVPDSQSRRSTAHATEASAGAPSSGQASRWNASLTQPALRNVARIATLSSRVWPSNRVMSGQRENTNSVGRATPVRRASVRGVPRRDAGRPPGCRPRRRQSDRRSQRCRRGCHRRQPRTHAVVRPEAAPEHGLTSLLPRQSRRAVKRKDIGCEEMDERLDVGCGVEFGERDKPDHRNMLTRPRTTRAHSAAASDDVVAW